MYARRATAIDAAALHAKTGDPLLRASIATFAARSVMDAATATATIWGWPVPTALAEPVAIMQGHLDERAK
jgi:hypothetical protein